MQRRQFIKASVVGGAVIGVGGIAWSGAGKGDAATTIDAALKRIDALAKTQLASSGAWNPHQVFSHCAQTVEYSMSAYPQPKLALFQATLGSAAFGVFTSRGKMMHGLSEPIAGAPVLEREPAAGQGASGLQRLHAALIRFQQFDGKLAPHFAYGMLTKEQYEKAHVMHFFNHLDEIRELA